MGYIFLSEDKNYYSVPYRFISKRVEVSYNRHSIYIHYNKERIASHKRNFRPGRYTTIKDHLSSTHQFYRNWSPDFFQKLARPYGLAVEEYVKALIDFKDYPEVAYKQCLGIIALGKTLPSDRLNNAFKRGLTSSRFGYHIIKNILHHKLDLHPPDLDTSSSHIEEHKNIRGASYYQ